MAGISERPWSGITRSSYASAAEYCAACLIDENRPGDPKRKSHCKLPVYEPERLGGLLNRRAVHAAADRLVRVHGGVVASDADRRAAARALLRLYGALGDPPPASLRALAGAAAWSAPETIGLGV